MERLQQTTIKELQVGDRFYRTGDKKKTVFTVVKCPIKKTHFRTYRYFALADGELHPHPINLSTQLTFLRHA